MDCAEAAPFVSRLHDGDDVPADAVRHVTSCAFCRERLREFTDAAVALRVLAATDRLDPMPALVLPAPTVAPAPRRTSVFWRAWSSPVRVPRAAAALVTLALVVASVGWFRGQTAERIVTEFHYRISSECTDSQGGHTTEGSSGMTLVGSRSSFFTSGGCLPEGRGLVGAIEPVSVRDGIVKIRVGFSLTDRNASPAARVAAEAIREYDYVPGQVLDVSVPGGPTQSITATIQQRVDAPAAPVSLETLIPKPGELAIAMPALIRDRHDLVVTINAGSTARTGHVMAVYAPGSGLFLFALDRFDGATEAQAGGAAIVFTSDGHQYTLYSTLPVTGGEQPHHVWVRHMSDYRPSEHGTFGGQDTLPGLGSGDLSAYVKGPGGR